MLVVSPIFGQPFQIQLEQPPRLTDANRRHGHIILDTVDSELDRRAAAMSRSVHWLGHSKICPCEACE